VAGVEDAEDAEGEDAEGQVSGGQGRQSGVSQPASCASSWRRGWEPGGRLKGGLSVGVGVGLEVEVGVRVAVGAAGEGNLVLLTRGAGANGRLGLGSARDEGSPVLVEALEGHRVVQVSVGSTTRSFWLGLPRERGNAVLFVFF